MSVFPRLTPFHQTTSGVPDLATLFSLLTDPTPTPHRRHAKPSRQTSFIPKFDVLETQNEYILEGELPGLVDKRKVEIEFSDAQTLVIRGRIEHNTEEEPAEEKKEQQQQEERPHSPPKAATVEDSPDEDEDYDDARRAATPPTPTSTEQPQQQQPRQKKREQPKTRYWVSERLSGAFQRSFSFPGLIDQDNVQAKLENGVLIVQVPKRAPRPAKRIEVC